jgi:hypothetical protein
MHVECPQREGRLELGGTMTIADLTAKLSAYPGNARVTLLHPDKPWLLPIEIAHVSAADPDRQVDFIAITADSASDEIEGLVDGMTRRRGSPPKRTIDGAHQQSGETPPRSSV